MDNQINNNPQPANNNKTIIGLILVGIGVLFLLKHVSFFFLPTYIFSWPLMLIAFGIYTGVKHNFKKSMWIIYTMVGVIFLLPNIIPSLSAGMLWPLLMVAIGITYLLRRDQQWNGNNWEKRNSNQYQNIDNNK